MHVGGYAQYNYHLAQCGMVRDCQAKGRKCQSRPRRWHNLYTTYLQLWGWYLGMVPGDESRGGSKSGEESHDQEGHTNEN
jgi:hypothetical protein